MRRAVITAAFVAVIAAAGCEGDESEGDSEAENSAGITPAEFEAVGEGTLDEEIESVRRADVAR